MSRSLARRNKDNSTRATPPPVGDWHRFDAGDSAVYSAASQDDGAVVVAGQTPTAAGAAFTVLRFGANGAIDTTFATGGRQTFETGGSAQAIAVAGLGRILVAGRVASSVAGRDSSVVVYRLSP
jgi:hypothetical protein